MRFSELTGFDGRLGPAGDLRALTGHCVLREWRHDANGQYQNVLQKVAAHMWQHPAYMSLPWEVAPQLAAQFIVRTSWPSQLRLLYHAFPGVLEDVRLRVDYEVQTDAATKRIMLARLPSLLRAFVHVGALLGDVPPAEALGLAERLVACTSDGASTAVSVGSFAALDTYLATRRAEVDRLHKMPVPLRVHAIEDAHRRATLDAAAAPMMLSPDDGASADETLGATQSTIGQLGVFGSQVVTQFIASARHLESVLPGAIGNLGAFPPAHQTPAWAPAPAAPAPPGSANKRRRGAGVGGGLRRMAPGSLAGSCNMSGGDLNMTVAPGVKSSSTTPDRKYVFHVDQFCNDKNIDRNSSCWPYMAEMARCNGSHFKRGADAPALFDAVAIARCPNARDPAHWSTKHVLLSDTLMLEFGTTPYFRPA